MFFRRVLASWNRRSVALGSGAAAATALALALDDKAHLCGIVGVVGGRNNGRAKDFLLEGLTILQNRGYDSAGITTLDPDQAIRTTKYASVGSTADSIDLLKKHSAVHDGASVGIAHTRWATHGGKTDANAHPHHDGKNRLALVHNGTISNANELRNELVGKGYAFKSETDTEVIAQLTGYYMDEGADIEAALKKALGRLVGTYGIAVVSGDRPDQVIAACNGSPLVIGVGSDRMFIASETTAFNRYTKEYISLKDGEVAVVHADGRMLDLGRIEMAPEIDVLLSPSPFLHWTIKEIYEQPRAIAASLNYGARMCGQHHNKVKLGGLDDNQEQMLQIKNIMLAACGTSYFAAMYGAKIMRLLRSFDTINTHDAGETTMQDLPHKDGGIIVVSQSGETKDVLRALDAAGQLGIPRISCVNAVGSLIARTTKLGVYLNAGRENAVASTKAFTTSVTVLALIASWFAQNREQGASSAMRQALLDSLQRLPISFGMALQRTREKCKQIATTLVDAEHCFILGKGFAEPIAKEGALKIKEITYLHAEGYSGAALKHGPFALINGPEGKHGRTPVIMIILDDEHADMMRIAAEEVKARGAHIIIITDKEELATGLTEDVITIPSNGLLTALIAVVPLQLIAYELAVLKGINPDVPRNLAKAVTVD